MSDSELLVSKNIDECINPVFNFILFLTVKNNPPVAPYFYPNYPNPLIPTVFEPKPLPRAPPLMSSPHTLPNMPANDRQGENLELTPDEAAEVVKQLLEKSPTEHPVGPEVSFRNTLRKWLSLFSNMMTIYLVDNRSFYLVGSPPIQPPLGPEYRINITINFFVKNGHCEVNSKFHFNRSVAQKTFSFICINLLPIVINFYRVQFVAYSIQYCKYSTISLQVCLSQHLASANNYSVLITGSHEYNEKSTRQKIPTKQSAAHPRKNNNTEQRGSG